MVFEDSYGVFNYSGTGSCKKIWRQVMWDLTSAKQKMMETWRDRTSAARVCAILSKDGTEKGFYALADELLGKLDCQVDSGLYIQIVDLMRLIYHQGVEDGLTEARDRINRGLNP